MKWANITHQEIWEEKWKDICSNNDGSVNLDQIQRELFDYAFLLEQVPQVYCEVAGLSKPNAYAGAVINEYQNKLNDSLKLWVEDFIDCNKDMYVLHKDSNDEKDREYAKGIKWLLMS